MLSVGEILKKTREKKALTLVDIEKELRIREKFLKAIEEDNWNFFSSKIYIEGIIKNYANFLGLDSKKMTAFFRREYEVNEEIKFKKRIASKYLTSETKRFAIIGLILVCLFFLIYFAFQLKNYLSPPKLIIIEPKTTIFKRVDKIKIIGKTDAESAITILGDRVYQDKDGLFHYDLPLKLGKNIFTVELTGANGKKAVIQKEYIRKE